MTIINYKDMIEGKEYEQHGAGNPFWRYKKENGILYVKIADWEVSDKTMDHIINNMEFVELPWHPKENEKYHYPSFDRLGGVGWAYWTEYNVLGALRKKRVGIYNTEEEAAEKAVKFGWVRGKMTKFKVTRASLFLDKKPCDEAFKGSLQNRHQII